MPALHLIPSPRSSVTRRCWQRSDAFKVNGQGPKLNDVLRKAGMAIDRVHARSTSSLRPGRTEVDVAADIAEAIVAEGHSGSHLRHRRVRPGMAPIRTTRVLGPGAGTRDVIVVDIGGPVEPGY